jgi:hypothetical protein
VTPNRRMLLWFMAVAGTVAAVVWVNGNEDDIAAPAAREHRAGDERPAHREGKATKELPELSLKALDTRGLDEMKTDLFASKSWYVPPPPPPPPKPTAPPVPFTFIGRLIEGGRTAVFVSVGDRNQVLRVGDVVDSTWRVDAIETTRMKLTYLPLNQDQYLALGAAP